MRKHIIPSLLTMIPIALMITTHSESAAAVPVLATGQEQSQRSRYVDGVYTATGQYGSRPSFITVTVTLRNGVIADVQVRTHATVPRSLELQRRFAAAVPRVVIGKPIDEVRVGKLAGSSGTPRGFNDALAKIRQQAAM